MEWISVKDELPKNNDNVLGMVDGKYRRVVFYLQKHSEQVDVDYEEFEDLVDYDEENGISYWKSGWYEELEQFQHEFDVVWTPREITHWMPLPEPPKQ